MPFPSRRSNVIGLNGAVATSQPLAAMAGMRMLTRGGNAADAAIAMAAALNVVEPMSTGMGGDAFCLVYWAKERRVYALNASGRAPVLATLDAIRARGYSEGMAPRGPLTVTVPGAPAGWADLLSRFGRLGLDTVLQPAIDYAQEGFPVSERIAAGWAASCELLRADPEAARCYLPGGRAPKLGQRFRNPDLAQSLRALAENGPEAFYRGPIAQAIDATMRRTGGPLRAEDLAAHTSTWETPIHCDYRGHRVWECPPNGQGLATLLALNVLQGFDLSAMRFGSPDATHLQIEAIKLAMADAAEYVADPAQADIPLQALLSEAYARSRRESIRMDRSFHPPEHGVLPTSHDTVYLCATDAEGNAVSFINSLYMGFGSGIVAEGTGICLQNRGALFSLDPDHRNCIAPKKRPYHTIIPAMVTKDDALAICFGVMGGFMQPQGQVQVLCNLLDHGMTPQAALDAPRFLYDVADRGPTHVETAMPQITVEALRARGQRLRVHNDAGYGGGQVIHVDPDSGAYIAGSEPRNDGCAMAW